MKLQANIKGMDKIQCARMYSRENVHLMSTQLCAGGVSGEDTCHGDSGSPLMVVDNSENNYYVLAGLVSFGPTPCGLEGWPGVYTRVSEFVSFFKI